MNVYILFKCSCLIKFQKAFKKCLFVFKVKQNINYNQRPKNKIFLKKC